MKQSNPQRITSLFNLYINMIPLLPPKRIMLVSYTDNQMRIPALSRTGLKIENCFLSRGGLTLTTTILIRVWEKLVPNQWTNSQLSKN